MPIITCGGMRMQQTWKPAEGFSISNVDPACQANFEAIVDYAMALGINHFETARGYGCSEVRDPLVRRLGLGCRRIQLPFVHTRAIDFPFSHPMATPHTHRSSTGRP